MGEVTQPTPAVRQVSGTDPEGRNILSVLVKATYTIAADGRAHEAEEQLPLTVAIQADADNPDLLAADTDIYPYKVATDVVLKGCAYNLTSRPPSFEASLRIGKARKAISVIGDRHSTLGADGRILFSSPVPVEKVPLRYDRAYGGRDAATESEQGNPWSELAPLLQRSPGARAPSPYTYPRNPAGVGYLIEATSSSVEGLKLPNLEDPDDPIRPERLAAGDVANWPAMPLPQGMDWVDVGWFPRAAYFGIVHEHGPLQGPVAEAARGYAPADVLDHKPLMEKFDFRFASGASLGLQLPYLRGDEEVELVHLSRLHARFTFRLPGERPRIWTDGRQGKLNKTDPVIHTVIIEPDLNRVSIVWRGCAKALRPYLEEELAGMPLKVIF